MLTRDGSGSTRFEIVEDHVGNVEVTPANADTHPRFVRAVEVRAPRRHQIVRTGEFGELCARPSVIARVVRLEPVELHPREVTDERGEAFERRLVRERMREADDATIFVGGVDHARRWQWLARHVRRAAIAEPEVEGLVDRSCPAATNEDGREVRTADDLALRLGGCLVERRREPERLESSCKRTVAIVAVLSHVTKECVERGRVIVDEIAEQMQRVRLEAARHLATWNEADADRVSSLLCCGETETPVVVREGDRATTGLPRQIDDACGRRAPVRTGRMGVEIDHLGTLPSGTASDGTKRPDGRMIRMREACGVFGVFAPGRQAAPLVYDGLFSLQHRGQESAGMAVSDGETVTVVKDMGLVASVFTPRALASLQGSIGLGHVRYSTMGKSDWRNAQPIFRPIGAAGFAIGHNGNLTNVAELEEQAGMIPGLAPSDSDLMGELLARELPPVDLFEGSDPLAEALMRVLPRLEGAFSVGCLDVSRLYAARDPNGFRPLCLGKLVDAGETTGWVVSSESPGLATVGAIFEREIEPGELVVIDEEGVRSLRPFDERRIEPRLCVFEFVYFARPDATLQGKEVHAARRRMGEQLFVEAPADVDVVIGVPDSGVPAAEGYARRSGIPFGHGLVKNRYIGRTFITPTAAAREDAVRRKLNPLRESVDGKRLVVIDDSIVRGTTTRQIVAMLRSAGAREVHLRISSPPFRWPCFYGIDTPRREELLAAMVGHEDIADHLGADSVAYLSLEGLFSAIGVSGVELCSACLTGEYPTRVPLVADRTVAAVAT